MTQDQSLQHWGVGEGRGRRGTCLSLHYLCCAVASKRASSSFAHFPRPRGTLRLSPPSLHPSQRNRGRSVDGPIGRSASAMVILSPGFVISLRFSSVHGRTPGDCDHATGNKSENEEERGERRRIEKEPRFGRWTDGTRSGVGTESEPNRPGHGSAARSSRSAWSIATDRAKL